MRKQITVTREVKTVTDPDEPTSIGGRLGTITAYIVAILMAAIVIGGLAWVAEAIWRAVL